MKAASARLRAWVWIWAAAVLAAAAPLVPGAGSARVTDAATFAGWPRTFEGRPLSPLAASPQDAYFTRDFPGKVARFGAGDRQVVIRWVNAPTRRLHPAAHCFEGAGYRLAPRPMRRSDDGALMSCFSARRHAESLLVCEQLRDSRGRSWSDVSSWYWHALGARAGESWWSYVIVGRER